MMKTKFLALMLALMLCMALFVSPASAFSGEGDALPNSVNTSWAEDSEPEPVTGGLEPGQSEPPSETSGLSAALTPEGNLTLIDDISDNTGTDKQFMTVSTRNGHYFYLIVDRAKDGENSVHFLNQVDEADLLPIIEDEDAAAAKTSPAVCICDEKCYPGHVDTSCPVCAVNMSECVGKEAVQPVTQEEPAEPETRQEASSIRFPL